MILPEPSECGASIKRSETFGETHAKGGARLEQLAYPLAIGQSPEAFEEQSVASACPKLQQQKSLVSEIKDIVEELQRPNKQKKSSFATKALQLQHAKTMG